MLGDRCDFQEGGEVLIGRSRSTAPTLRLQRRSGFRGLQCRSHLRLLGLRRRHGLTCPRWRCEGAAFNFSGLASLRIEFTGAMELQNVYQSVDVDLEKAPVEIVVCSLGTLDRA